MPARAHSRATRMAATFLARQSGAEQAAATFGIDPRTVRGWLESVEVPDDQWTAIRDVLQARAAEMAATGTTRGLVATLTGAGIADRNVRYSTLIARREERRSAETCDCVLPPGWPRELHPKAGTPEHKQAVWAIAEANMSPARRAFMQGLRPLLIYYIDFQDGEHTIDIPEVRDMTAAALAGVPDDTGDLADVLQRWITDLDDETLAARQALVDAAQVAYVEAIREELRRRAPPAPPQAQDPAPEQPEVAPAPADEPVPIATARAARPAPSPMVFDVGAEDHDRGWHPYERREF